MLLLMLMLLMRCTVRDLPWSESLLSVAVVVVQSPVSLSLIVLSPSSVLSLSLVTIDLAQTPFLVLLFAVCAFTAAAAAAVHPSHVSTRTLLLLPLKVYWRNALFFLPLLDGRG